MEKNKKISVHSNTIFQSIRIQSGLLLTGIAITQGFMKVRLKTSLQKFYGAIMDWLIGTQCLSHRWPQICLRFRYHSAFSHLRHLIYSPSYKTCVILWSSNCSIVGKPRFMIVSALLVSMFLHTLSENIKFICTSFRNM